MPKVVNGEVVMSSFDTLYAVDCSAMVEKKTVGGVGLTYLSWSDAWAIIMKMYPDASYEFVLWDRPDGTKKFYNSDSTGAFVMTKVTIEGITRTMMLPVMDGANKAMKETLYSYTVKNGLYRYAKPNAQGVMVDKNGQPVEEYITKAVEPFTSFDVNKTLMRCLVKNLAMFGLGLYIYSGEDLPGTPDEEDLTKLLKKFNETRQALSEYTDVHSDTFNDWLMRKANIHNTDPGVLLNFPAEMKRAIAEMEKAIEKKKNSGQ